MIVSKDKDTSLNLIMHSEKAEDQLLNELLKELSNLIKMLNSDDSAALFD